MVKFFSCPKKFVLLLLFIKVVLSITPLEASLMPTISPIAAYEKHKEYTPSPHDEERISYGARVRVGPSFFGIELSYLEGNYNKIFSDGSNSKVKTKKSRGGISSMFGDLLRVEGRGGVEERVEKRDVYDSGGTLTSTSGGGKKYYPYLGGTASLRFLPLVRVYVGVTYTFIDTANWQKLGDQIAEYSAGFSVQLSL